MSGAFVFHLQESPVDDVKGVHTSAEHFDRYLVLDTASRVI